MTMTYDQRNNEAQRLASQLLLDAQSRTIGSSSRKYRDDDSANARQFGSARCFRREWETNNNIHAAELRTATVDVRQVR